jgi:SAM-dependent methyltransferase
MLYKNAKKVQQGVIHFFQGFYEATLLQKMFYVLTIIVSYLLLTNYGRGYKEGFATDKKKPNGGGFILKRGIDAYDEFYANIYDELVFSKVKNDYEIGAIIESTRPTKQSRILDVGSGVGHHVSSFAANGFKNVQGIDVSKSMVLKAQQTYPDLRFSQEDVLNTMLFDAATFTHITCLYFTIYYIEDPALFFKNCAHWLMPGGFLALHLVHPEKFDPILPAGDPFTVVSPQNYASKRITSTNVKFNEFDYKANFKLNSGSTEATFTEIFKNGKTGNTRKNIHELHMPSEQALLNLAKAAGFIVTKKFDMVKCHYSDQFLYILQKPQ